jgi:glycosyltransferase involved in cell wall biosynthesis
VRHPHGVGYGRSLKKGIEAATFDTIVICDADGTYPAAAIPKLVGLYDEGFDMVVGQRQGPHYRQSAIKVPLRVLLRFLVEWTAGCRMPDVNSGPRVFSRDTAASISRIYAIHSASRRP